MVCDYVICVSCGVGVIVARVGGAPAAVAWVAWWAALAVCGCLAWGWRVWFGRPIKIQVRWCRILPACYLMGF